MSDTYTPNFFFRKPAVGDKDWQDEFWQNQDIKDVILASLVNASLVTSGLAVTQTGNFQVSWEAGTVYVGGFYLTVDAGNASAVASTPLFRTPWYLSVDDAGVVQFGTTPPSGDFALLAVVDVTEAQIEQVADCRVYGRVNQTVNTFYVNPAGDDSGAGTLGDPWATVAGALANLQVMDFAQEVDLVTLQLAAGTYTEAADLVVTPQVVDRPFRIIGNTTTPSTVVISRNTAGQVLTVKNSPHLVEVHGVRLSGRSGTSVGLVADGGLVNPYQIEVYSNMTAFLAKNGGRIVHTGGGNAITVQDMYQVLKADGGTISLQDTTVTGADYTDNHENGQFCYALNNGLIYLYAGVTAHALGSGGGTSVFHAEQGGRIVCDSYSISGIQTFSCTYGIYADKRSTIQIKNGSVANFVSSSGYDTYATDSSFIRILTADGNTGFSGTSPAYNTVGNRNSYIATT